VQSECAKECDPDIAREEFNPRRRSSLQVPLLLNPHERVGRRHSDGTKKKNIRNQFQIGMPISKSEYNVRANDRTGFKETDRLLDNSDDISYTESDFTGSYGNITDNVIQTDTERDNTSIAGKSEEGLNFMDKLEEIHSDTCKSPLELRRIVDASDKDSSCDTDVIRKSFTLNSIKDTPKLVIHKDKSMPAMKYHQAERPQYSDKKDSFADKSAIFLETLQSSRKSKSCVEISPKPKRSDLSTKAKSYDILETEFGAKTPNEVRTIHVRTKRDSLKDSKQPKDLFETGKKCFQTINDKICEKEACPSIKEVETSLTSAWFNDKKDIAWSCPNDSVLKDNNVFNEDRHKDQGLDNSRADSGHVSLLENINLESDRTDDCSHEKNDLMDHIDCFETGNKIGPSVGMNSHEKLRRLKPDVSPDSWTDVSESLITDSVKTEDETVIDIDTDSPVINNLHGPLVDTSVTKSTDL
jgi:hypothetical protein